MPAEEVLLYNAFSEIANKILCTNTHTQTHNCKHMYSTIIHNTQTACEQAAYWWVGVLYCDLLNCSVGPEALSMERMPCFDVSELGDTRFYFYCSICLIL